MKNNIKEEFKDIEVRLKDKRPWCVNALVGTGLVYIILIIMFLCQVYSTQSQSFLISTIGYLFGLIGIIGFIHFRRLDHKLNLLIQNIAINNLMTCQIKESVDGIRLKNNLPEERWTDNEIKKSMGIYNNRKFKDRDITITRLEKKIWDLYLISNEGKLLSLMSSMLLNREVHFYCKYIENYKVLVINYKTYDGEHELYDDEYEIYREKDQIIIIEPEESIYKQLYEMKSYKINGKDFLYKAELIDDIRFAFKWNRSKNMFYFQWKYGGENAFVDVNIEKD